MESREKVLKALGLCGKKIKGDCPDCPYNMEKDDCCIEKMCNDAYDLIYESKESDSNA